MKELNKAEKEWISQLFEDILDSHRNKNSKVKGLNFDDKDFDDDFYEEKQMIFSIYNKLIKINKKKVRK